MALIDRYDEQVTAREADECEMARRVGNDRLLCEVNFVRAAPAGEQNNALNRAAFALGQLVAAGKLTEDAVVQALLAATSLPHDEALTTIRSVIEVVTQTMTTYRITATFERDGQILNANQAEVLGDAYGRTYASREDAEAEAERMQGEVEDYGLDATTTYHVEECD